jgi:hypothetical protein
MVFNSYKRSLEVERIVMTKIEQAIFYLDDAQRMTHVEYRKETLDALNVILRGVKREIEENEFQVLREGKDD